MNYKILILLGLLFIIFMVYLEVMNIKKTMLKLTELNLNIKDEHNNTINRIQNNMIKYVEQIKNISNDNLQQLKKITLLNQQPITRISNHFTETDDDENHSDIQYLSDMRNQFKKEESKNSDYYMSENTNKKNRNKCNNDKYICDGDICILNKEISDLPIYSELQDDIPLYESKEVLNNLNLIDNDSDSESLTSSTDDIEEKQELIENESDENKQTKINNEFSTENNEIKIDISKIKTLTGNIDIENITNNDIYINKSTENVSETDSIEIEKNIQQIDMSQSIKDILNDSRVKKIEQENNEDLNTKIEILKNNDIKKDKKEKKDISQYSRKSIRSRIQILDEEEKDKSDEEKKDKSDDNELSDNLKNVEEYNMNELRDIARKYSLSITLKENETSNRRRILKKDELYNNIKEYLKKKNKI